MIGEDGGIQWGALLSYNFALSLLIVTTNVVVLCEYLPHEFPLWGTIKGYCIVMYSTVVSCPGLHPSFVLFNHNCDFSLFLLPRCFFSVPICYVSAPYVIGETTHEM